MDVPLLITKINTVQINVLSRTNTFKSSFQVARELSKLVFVNLEDIHQYLWNSLPRVCAIDLPTLVLPTPGGPTKQRIGPANHSTQKKVIMIHVRCLIYTQLLVIEIKSRQQPTVTV